MPDSNHGLPQAGGSRAADYAALPEALRVPVYDDHTHLDPFSGRDWFDGDEDAAMKGQDGGRRAGKREGGGRRGDVHREGNAAEDVVVLVGEVERFLVEGAGEEAAFVEGGPGWGSCGT